MANTEAKTSGSPESLRGLDRVGLDIEQLPPEFKDTEIKQQDLFGFVKSSLRNAPVQVISRTGALHLLGAPTLFLNVSLFEQQPETYVYVVALELVQGAKMERLTGDDRFGGVPTWRAQVVGLTTKCQLVVLKDSIAATGEAFAKDLREVVHR